MILGFTGMGLLAGASVIVIKRGNPLGWALRGGSVVLGGVFYPTEVLPPLLQAIGLLLPVTHALDVLRGSMLAGQDVIALAPQIAMLAVLSVAYLAAGIVACAGAIRYAQVDGSLAQY
jgi:ABC-2 type transport system permease protein